MRIAGFDRGHAVDAPARFRADHIEGAGLLDPEAVGPALIEFAVIVADPVLDHGPAGVGIGLVAIVAAGLAVGMMEFAERQVAAGIATADRIAFEGPSDLLAAQTLDSLSRGRREAEERGRQEPDQRAASRRDMFGSGAFEIMPSQYQGSSFSPCLRGLPGSMRATALMAPLAVLRRT